MISDFIDKDKFLSGVKYGLIGEGVLGIIFSIFWLILVGTLSTFPLTFFSFGIGGLFLVVAGCIGPGRYMKDYKLLLYTPESGSSFSNEIKVSGFTVDPNIKSADIIVNGQKAGELDFSKNTSAVATINRENFISEVINRIVLRFDEFESNTSDFTLFEYTDDMTEEEVEELYNMEKREPEKLLEIAEEDYNARINRRTGSVAAGIVALATLNFLFVFIVSTFYNLNF